VRQLPAILNRRTVQDKKSPYQTYIKPNWWTRNWVESTIILGGIITINLIFISKAFRQTDMVDPTTAGQLGDFVGGYIGTILALISVVLIYSTFKEQRHSSTTEKFQNKYFELIKMHRDNVAEIGIGADFGKKIFVLLIREFRAILNIAKELSESKKLNYDKEQLFIISYYVLFFGVGPNSSRMLKEALRDFDKTFVDEFEKKLNNQETKNKVKEDRKFPFKPFEGHQSRLGHYYRHLYQTVCFVDNQEIDIDKYEYVKTIRAQLTTHEQALLFINCLTPIGKIWWTKNLLLKYRFVQNVPISFFNKDTEIEMDKYFPDDYFEWQEGMPTDSKAKIKQA
jgi:hypothetical protein